MAFTSQAFLLFVLLVVLSFNASSARIWREAVLSVASLVFIVSFVSSFMQLVPLIGFLALGYVATLAIRRWPRPAVLATLTAVVVVVFAVLKRYTFLPEDLQLSSLYLSVGLSYILFRVLQLVIDGASPSDQAPLGVLAYFNYTCNFLSFVSGPIERSEAFVENRKKQLQRLLDDELAFRALARIVKGYFKLAVVSALAQYAFNGASTPLLKDAQTLGHERVILDYGLSVTCYTIYLYSNFAGYMDIVIGIGWLLGQDLPENFNHPFAARNLFEFWARWHITLSEWFKTYLFNPLVKLFAGSVSNPKALPYLGVLAFFISFFVMGVWHGSTLVFVIYGLVMGAGVSLNKLWQIAMTKRLGKKPYRALTEKALYSSLAQGLTFAFFAMAVTALWVNFEQLQLIGQRLGAMGVLLVLLLTTLAAASVFAVARVVERHLPDGEAVWRWITARRYRHLAVAAQLLMILIVASFFHKAPEFVYKAF
jgi:D-alanyl-lipoteichoic acid acyltransferase DltB (MBOAT superfamily)